MATPPPIPNCIQVRLIYTTPSKANIMNVIHGFSSAQGPLNPNVADTMFTAMVGSGDWPLWLQSLPVDTTFVGFDIRDMRMPNSPLLQHSFTAIPGTAATGPLPPQTCIVLTLRTANAGAQFRGRIFCGALATVNSDATGHISTVGMAAPTHYVSAIGSGFAAIGWQLGLAQRFLPARPGHGNVTLPERPAACVPVTATIVRDNIFDTQRRRTGAHVGSR